MYDMRIINGHVYIDGTYQNTNVYVKDGVIAHIHTDLFDATETIDASKKLVLPGIIDPHTHFQLDIGTTVSADDFYSGSVSAAYGGVTTFIDFLDPVSNAIDLEKAFTKRSEQAQDSVIDYSFHACLKNPKKEVHKIVKTMKKLGLERVKLFTTYSDSNRRTYDPEIKQLLQISKHTNLVVLVHAENDDLIDTSLGTPYQKLPDVRPTTSEITEAIKLAKMTKETGGTLYMVHVSSGLTIQTLQSLYSDIINTKFFIETCPHYIHFNNEILQQDNGYLYTMAPPLRTKEEQVRLIKNIKFVYTIGTDHCPFLQAEKKQKTLDKLPLGIGSVEHSFDVMYALFQESIIDKMTSNVAKAHHLYPKKGVIQVGSDADVFIYDLSKPKTIESHHSKGDYTPYQGITTLGSVESTISRGKFVIKNGVLQPNKGHFLKGNLL